MLGELVLFTTMRNRLSAASRFDPLSVAGKLFGQDFDGDIAAELLVASSIHFSQRVGADRL